MDVFIYIYIYKGCRPCRRPRKKEEGFWWMMCPESGISVKQLGDVGEQFEVPGCLVWTEGCQ